SSSTPKKLSFKEKFEFENLENELAQLMEEKKLLDEKMALSLPYEELQKAATRMGLVLQLIDEKEMRWLELSERL
ncbi:MAG TPA: ABC transporter C-terminal domain-containing protein, partial [Ferruginibacter sp.]|nr:ABC transporter C-terminal domain-containing protein [Ferruginibacter sp.]